QGCASGAVSRPGPDHRQRQELRPGRPGLDLGAHGGADAAVVAPRPPAVPPLSRPGPVHPVPPVLPEPTPGPPRLPGSPPPPPAVSPLGGGVPVRAQGRPRGARRRRPPPALEGEVLGPAVEPRPVPPRGLDHRRDPAVTARQQALDDRRLAVVIPVADRPAVA